MNQRLTEIHKEIDALILDLLGPLRTSKAINRSAFDKLYLLLDEVKEIVENEDIVPKKLVGKLFFIYMSMNGEGGHTQYPDPIFMEIGRVESYLDEIFKSE